MEVKKGYKKTEIGIIPNDWVVTNIIENSTLKARIGWQGLTTAEYLENGNYILITGTDFNDGEISWDTCHYVSNDRYDQDKNIQIKDDDILITKDGTIGKVAFIKNLPSPATLNSGIFVIRPKNGSYIPHFLFYIFYSIFFNEFLRKLVAGSTINHLYQKDFKSFRFPLPPTKEEQVAIAQVLSDTDELISSLEKLIEKKKLIKQGTMQQLLTGKKRLPGFSGERTENTIGEICTCFAGGTPSTFNTKYWDGDIIWLPSGRIQNNRIIKQENEITITELGLKESAAKLIKTNSVLIAITGATCGNIGLLEFEATANQSVIALEPNEKNNYQFLYYKLLTKRKEILSNQTGSAQGGVNLKNIKRIKLELPDKSEQIEIARILVEMDTEIESLEQKLNKYKSIKQGMMQNLLTGKIRLVKPNSEAA